MNHLKVILNISCKFHPGSESIGEYLIRQGIKLIEIGSEMLRVDDCDLEAKIKSSDTDWETEGEY